MYSRNLFTFVVCGWFFESTHRVCLKMGEKYDITATKICDNGSGNGDDYRSGEQALHFTAKPDQCDSWTGKRDEYHDF